MADCDEYSGGGCPDDSSAHRGHLQSSPQVHQQQRDGPTTTGTAASAEPQKPTSQGIIAV